MEQFKKGQVDECDIVGSLSSSDSESEISSGSSKFEFDSYKEEVTSPASLSSSNELYSDDPFSDMSSLFQQLPIKRGLSKYYKGKARTFTSLAKVSSLEDLVKPEISYNKKLKSCRSYGEAQEHCTISAISSYVSLKGLYSAGSCSSLRAKGRSNNNFIGSRPPIPPHTSTSSNKIPNQTALLV